MSDNDQSESTETERIAKRIARAGLCSRRDAERWIADGRVVLNGSVVTTPATGVLPTDSIEVDGKPLPAIQEPRLWRYHKPSGLVVTARDEKGRSTIFDRLPPELPRVISVGRLDLNSEGLLLLTNDGEIARKLELPSTGWTRTYRVRVRGRVDADRLASLADGITVDGIRYGPIRAHVDNQQATNAWVTISLTEGKNREIRRVMDHLGYSVNRLIRTSFGPFQLLNLSRGGVEEVPGKTIRDTISGQRQGKAQSKWAKAKPKAKRPASRKSKKGPPGKSDPAEKPPGRPTGKPNADRRR